MADPFEFGPPWQHRDPATPLAAQRLNEREAMIAARFDEISEAVSTAGEIVTALDAVGSSVTAIEDITRVAVAATGVAATDRANLNTTLATGKDVEIRAGNYLIDSSLVPVSGQKITIRDGATIKASVHDWLDTGMIDINNLTDVVIEGGILDGDKADNPTGRVFGVSIRGASSRIRVYGTRVINTPGIDATGNLGGDGFYIGGGTGTPYDVRLQNVTTDGCVRQGLSITKGENIRVDGCTFKNTTGTLPGAGIDLEPDVAGTVMRDIHLTNNTIDSASRGINVAIVAAATEDVQGDIIISGNRIYNITEATYGYGIFVNNCREGVKVHGNLIRSAIKWGIYVEAGTDADIQGNTIRDCGADGIRMGTCLRFAIKGNRIRHSVSGACILVSAGTTSGDIEGNTLQLGAAAASYGVRSDVTTTIGIKNNDIYGNSTSTGIGVYLGNGGDKHNITGNTVTSAQVGVQTPSGADNNVVVGNTLSTCATPTSNAGAGNTYANNN